MKHALLTGLLAFALSVGDLGLVASASDADASIYVPNDVTSMLQEFDFTGHRFFAYSIPAGATDVSIDTFGNGFMTFLGTNPYDGTLVSFDPRGHVLWTVHGLYNPMSVSLGPLGGIFVAQAGAGTVTEYNKNGRYIATVLRNLSHPMCVAASPSYVLYVCDGVASQFEAYTYSGNMTMAPVPLQAPARRIVAVGHSVFVASGAMLQTFTPGGMPTSPTIAPPGSGNIAGLAIGLNGNIYLGRGSVFSSFKPDGSQGGLTMYANDYLASFAVR